MEDSSEEVAQMGSQVITAPAKSTTDDKHKLLPLTSVSSSTSAQNAAGTLQERLEDGKPNGFTDGQAGYTSSLHQKAPQILQI
jgi:hypothetical protein